MIKERVNMDCDECGGTGEIERNKDGADEMLVCPKCNGLGTIWEYTEEPEYEPEEE